MGNTQKCMIYHLLLYLDPYRFQASETERSKEGHKIEETKRYLYRPERAEVTANGGCERESTPKCPKTVIQVPGIT